MRDRYGETTDSGRAAEAAAPADPRAAVVDAWFLEYIQVPPISQNTGCYNQALAAKEKLKKLLAPSP